VFDRLLSGEVNHEKENAVMTIWPIVGLLLASNVFMTVAWYGHLRFLNVPIWLAVLGSWSVALLEYCFQVPANRIGYAALSGYQLKTLQEAITLVVFVIFAGLYLGESFLPKHLIGFVMLALAVWTVFQTQYGMKW
jgi:uncharacterized protein (DUF486 family)